jgi:hypothetical protein
MINPAREIRPEDFAPDFQKQYCSVEERAEAVRHKAELKRLYQIQEEAKAREHFKREQARKDLIPYSEAIASAICGRISAGEFLTLICLDGDMPTVRGTHQWFREHPDFAALHKEAVNNRLDIFEDEVVTIADDSERDFKMVTKHGKQAKVLDADVISRAKLRIDARKAHLKAYRPSVWGEQSTLNVKQDENSMEICRLRSSKGRLLILRLKTASSKLIVPMLHDRESSPCHKQPLCLRHSQSFVR